MNLAKRVFETARNEKRTFVLENEAKDILASYGIPVPPYATARTADEAVEKARKIGFPVVLKILSKDILHKSDAGGVKVDLRDENAVRQAFDDIIANARRYGVEKGIEVDLSRGVIVSKYAEPGTEVIVGVTCDPQFGHAMMFGLGGIFVEVLKDVTFRLVPLSEADAREMVREIRAAKILEGIRGQAPRDLDALVKLMLAVSKMVEDNPEIQELDCNPVFVYAKDRGAMVVDARIIIEGPPPDS
ncbi:MAG: acetate--CoA ligase family protein [Candidatus Thorarchaeota archaeon]